MMEKLPVLLALTPYGGNHATIIHKCIIMMMVIGSDFFTNVIVQFSRRFLANAETHTRKSENQNFHWRRG
jgi:hypothetical protein